jgi:hypothetical protein
MQTVFVQHHDIGTGPLTFAVKDCIDVVGLPTYQGSAVFAEAAPRRAMPGWFPICWRWVNGGCWASWPCMNWPLA